MDPNEKITQLENEIKVLKNEVQAVLLDLRDKYLEAENPFNVAPAPAVAPQIIIDRQPAEVKAKDDPPQRNKADQDKNEAIADEKDKKEMEPETAYEEVKKARLSDQTPHRIATSKNHSSEPVLSLVAIAGLAQWADESVKKLGKTKTETILDISEMMGLLPRDLRQIMTKLVNVEDVHADGAQTRDYLESLIEVTALLGKDNQTEETLLSILSSEDSHR